MLLYKDEFIAKGNDDKLRYGFWDPTNETFHNIYTDYPQLSNEDEDNWALTEYAVKAKLSPDGKTLVSATYIGGILELFDIDDNGLKLRTARFFFEPRYNYAQGAKPRWVTTSSESIIGFEDLFLTNDAIYGLVWGVERPQMENSMPQLFCFDFDGNPVKSYILNDALESVAVDDDGTIYGVGCDSVGQYKLCKYIITSKDKSKMKYLLIPISIILLLSCTEHHRKKQIGQLFSTEIILPDTSSLFNKALDSINLNIPAKWWFISMLKLVLLVPFPAYGSGTRCRILHKPATVSIRLYSFSHRNKGSLDCQTCLPRNAHGEQAGIY